jgi:hypothetical protein
MAEIVILQNWRDRQPRRAEIRIGKADEVVSGRLLLFTGIRYERLEQAPPSLGALMVLEQGPELTLGLGGFQNCWRGRQSNGAQTARDRNSVAAALKLRCGTIVRNTM